jgi:hypothetical protein
MLKLLLPAALVVAAAVCAGHAARAQSVPTKAFIGGLRSDKLGSPEIVVFNSSGSPLTLDLVLRGPDGVALATLPAAMTVPATGTAVFDVQAALKTVGPNGKAYLGLVTVELTGDAPFGSATTVVHATQYFGSRKKPKAGFVVRALFREGS